MERERVIVIDGYQINAQIINSAFQSAKQQNKGHLVLAQTFRMMNMNKLYESNPGDQSVKQAIKAIVDSQFLPRDVEQSQFTTSFDLAEVFPLNKIGNFGRVLYRRCRLAENGIKQFSDDGQGEKIKQIKTFVNRVQKKGAPDNDNKIEWHQQSSKYPFRIILIDSNDGHKAIYFTTLEKAENIRIVLSQKYLYKGNFKGLLASANANYLNLTAELFKNKLISRFKMLNKSNRYSRKVNLVETPVVSGMMSRGDPSLMMSRGDPNVSIFSKDRFQAGQSGNNSRISSPTSAIKISDSSQIRLLQQKMLVVNGFYLDKMFSTWLQRSKLRGSSLKRNNMSPLQRQAFSQVNQSESIYKSRFDNPTEKMANKQESIFNRLVEYNQSSLKKSELRGSTIKQFQKENEGYYEELHFYSIQFPTLSSLFFKPIVTIELSRNGKAEQRILYNTVIKRKEPALVYDLFRNKEEGEESCLRLSAGLKQYDINVKVIDFLANEEVMSDQISMNNKRILGKSNLLCDHKLIKLEFGPKKANEKAHLFQEQAEHQQIKMELKVPPLPQIVRQKINQYWQRQSQLQGYYNETNLSIFKILSQVEVIPLTWWKGISEDEYQLFQSVYSASRILGFKMVRSFPHIIRAFVVLYPNVQQLTEKLLSFIITFLKSYYFPDYLNRIQKFHRLLGLGQDCELISKVNFQMLVIEKMVELQCASLIDNLSRANLSFSYQMMQYIYQAFSRNFTPGQLVQIWNTLYENMDLLQLNMVLLSVSLIKHYEEDLISAKRLNDFARILESKKISKVHHIINGMNALREKYFGEDRGLFDQIKNIFSSKPLESALQQFYKKESAKVDRKKAKRVLDKKSTLRKVNRQIDIQFPEYACQHYTLHIYFTKIPDVNGSLTIRCNGINYECLNHQKSRYFIIGEVSSTLTLAFVDLKSTEFACELILNQGIQEHTVSLISPRNSTVHKVTYLGGLLTDSQIEIYKRGKKFDHFLSPFTKEVEFRSEMNRPIEQTYFLRKYDSGNAKEDLVARIKNLFCSGNKSFDQIQFYIEQIETSDLTIQEKLELVKGLARQFSLEYCLCNNEIFQKHFIKIFMESTGYELNSKQYECFYNDSLQYQFDAPKILKCRYYPNLQPTRQLKLELQALNYYISKCSNYLYSDIIIDDLIQSVKSSISQQLGGFFEGELKLFYSSNGQVFQKSWHLKLRGKNSKQIYYQQIKQATSEDLQVRQIGEPQILMTEVLPSFAKISTILDYVNANRHVDLKHKYQDKDRKKIVENINIFKDCQPKFNKIITMRHHLYPSSLHFPFFNYYYELTHQFSTPIIKNIVLNNIKSDLKAVCLFGGSLKFGQNAKIQAFTYKDEIGLYGNLRLMSKDAKGWFFFGAAKDDYDGKNQYARVFVNYGYGIFRWQPCQVLGYYKRAKPIKNASRSSNSPGSKPKKQYLIVRRGQEQTVKEYQLQIGLQSLGRVQELFDSPQSRMTRQSRKYTNNEQEQQVGGSLKYLSKFIK